MLGKSCKLWLGYFTTASVFFLFVNFKDVVTFFKRSDTLELTCIVLKAISEKYRWVVFKTRIKLGNLKFSYKLPTTLAVAVHFWRSGL